MILKINNHYKDCTYDIKLKIECEIQLSFKLVNRLIDHRSYFDTVLMIDHIINY